MRNVSNRRPEDRILADIAAIEAAHLQRIADRAMTIYGALGQLVACIDDYERHGAACAEDLHGAIAVARKVLAKVEGRAA